MDSPPTIVVSENDETRQLMVEELLGKYNLKLLHPDVLLIAEVKLGVEVVKKVKQFLSVKPLMGEHKGVVINPADNLTSDAQNALLKTLEEPFLSSVILLGVSSEEIFLPTVLSRCLIVRDNQLVEKFLAEEIAHVKDLVELTLEKRLEMVDKVTDKERLVEKMAAYYQSRLKTDQQVVNYLKKIITAQGWIKQHVSPKSVLEYLMVVMPESS